jgi:hypothetical protein
MTDFRDRAGATEQWRATIEALEAVVLAAPDGPEIDPTEANEVRRLIMVRVATARRNNLPAAWVRRPGIVPQIVPDAEPAPSMTERDDPKLPSPDQPGRPREAWRE